MHDILFQYELNPTTWAYLSALLTLGIYFKFGRFWSVRNLDLAGLIVFSPGLLLVFHGLDKIQHGDTSFGPALVQFGYQWMFAVGGLFLVRLFLDPIMVRRPLLEPNLNAGGLTFTGTAMLVFLIANVLANRPPERLEHMLHRQEADSSPTVLSESPGYRAFFYLASFCDTPQEPKEPNLQEGYPSTGVQVAVSRVATIAALLALVVAMVVIGYRHFGNIQTGVAAVSLFLLLPYTDQMVGRVDHLIPAALLVGAVAAYRRPLPAGLLLGTAGGLIFYPLLLFPLWCSFYWRRGLTRYLVGMAVSLGAMIVVLASLPRFGPVVDQLRQMFGLTLLGQDASAGFWCDLSWAARIPVLAVFAVFFASLGLWPAHKNLGTLLSCTTAVMLGAQYCQGHEGGLYMAWYLPLLVLTIFRPNLEDRVAQSAVIEGRSTWVATLARGLRRRRIEEPRMRDDERGPGPALHFIPHSASPCPPLRMRPSAGPGAIAATPRR